MGYKVLKGSNTFCKILWKTKLTDSASLKVVDKSKRSYHEHTKIKSLFWYAIMCIIIKYLPPELWSYPQAKPWSEEMPWKSFLGTWLLSQVPKLQKQYDRQIYGWTNILPNDVNLTTGNISNYSIIQYTQFNLVQQFVGESFWAVEFYISWQLENWVFIA